MMTYPPTRRPGLMISSYPTRRTAKWQRRHHKWRITTIQSTSEEIRISTQSKGILSLLFKNLIKHKLSRDLPLLTCCPPRPAADKTLSNRPNSQPPRQVVCQKTHASSASKQSLIYSSGTSTFPF